MTTPQPSDDDRSLIAGLQRVHHGVLALLAVCAVLAAMLGAPGDAPPAPGRVDPYTVTGIALALVSIFTRRRQPAAPDRVRSHVALAFVSLVTAAGIGAVGVAAALGGATRATALVMVLAGAIFALRPPPGLAAPGGEAP